MNPVCFGCYKPLRVAAPRYCPQCVRLLFDGQAVAPTLPFGLGSLPDEEAAVLATVRRISISGVQFKVSLRLVDGQLRPGPDPARQEYLLKPPPRSIRIKHSEAVPANEHLTMQLARQVFGLNVAACGVVKLADGPTAYLTRRFDVLPTGERLQQEDFAQLAQRSAATHGPNFKYDYSHEEAAALVRRFVPAAALALDEFFRLTLFNYLVSNGDAHLKNFSLYRLPSGEYRLTPAYDLLNTSLHVDDGNNLALNLLAHDDQTASFAANAYLAYDDFAELGRRLGLSPSRVSRALADAVGHEAAVDNLLARSFLPDDLRQRYAANLESRRQRLRYSLAGTGTTPPKSRGGV